MPMLLRHPALRPLRRGRTRTTRVFSTYFDSPDFRLQRDGVTLRVRRVGRRWVQTLKGPPQAGAGLHARAEYEWPLPTRKLDLSQARRHALEEACGEGGQDGGLVAFCTTEFERRTVDLEFRGWNRRAHVRGSR